MRAKNLTPAEIAELHQVREGLHERLGHRRNEIDDAGVDTGNLATAIAAAQADLATAYAAVTTIVARRR